MLIRPSCRFVSMVTSGLSCVPPVFIHTASTASMVLLPLSLPVYALASFMFLRFHRRTKACCHTVCLHYITPLFMTHHYMSTLRIPSYHLASIITSWLADVPPVFVHVASMVMLLYYIESSVMSFHTSCSTELHATHKGMSLHYVL